MLFISSWSYSWNIKKLTPPHSRNLLTKIYSLASCYISLFCRNQRRHFNFTMTYRERKRWRQSAKRPGSQGDFHSLWPESRNWGENDDDFTVQTSVNLFGRLLGQVNELLHSCPLGYKKVYHLHLFLAVLRIIFLFVSPFLPLFFRNTTHLTAVPCPLFLRSWP